MVSIACLKGEKGGGGKVDEARTVRQNQKRRKVVVDVVTVASLRVDLPPS